MDGKRISLLNNMQSKYSTLQLSFNLSPPFLMHIDLNSCFASVEQQANPFLRGKPVAVCAYTTPSGCILAASVEAKRLGIKTGMRVKEGKLLCRNLVILPSDPWKYRNVHLKLKKLLENYSSEVIPKSIDEFVVDFSGYEIASSRASRNDNTRIPYGGSQLKGVALKIKKRIKEEVGDWLTVSIGIAPNRFLAKLASNFHKPDGLDEINCKNYLDCYLGLKLTDLPYIKARNALRLNRVGIHSVFDFYNAPLWKLRAAFHSINGYYWYMRLRGYEIDDVTFARRSYGNSYALPKPFSKIEDLSPIISKLTEKMSFRLRRAGYMASGVHLAIVYRNGHFWHKGIGFDKGFFESGDIYKKILQIFNLNPYKFPVGNVFVSVYNLKKITSLQLNFFEDIVRKKKLSEAVDGINERWGDFVISPARMLLGNKEMVPDRIAFGAAGFATEEGKSSPNQEVHGIGGPVLRGIKELEEFTMEDEMKDAG